MSSYLIISKSNALDTTAITEAISIASIPTFQDILILSSLDGKSIGIDRSTEVIRFAQKRPANGTTKLAVINDAHTLTIEAQNALLRVLEGHPDYMHLVLVAPSESGLLETVLSRCKRFELTNAVTAQDKKKGKEKPLISIEELYSLPIGERSGFAARLSKKEKDEILQILRGWVVEEHKSSRPQNAEKILNTITDLQTTNVNTRLGLEVLFFGLVE